jgi:hypothetical protein
MSLFQNSTFQGNYNWLIDTQVKLVVGNNFPIMVDVDRKLKYSFFTSWKHDFIAAYSYFEIVGIMHSKLGIF